MLTRKEIENWEVKNLSPLAMKARDSWGRQHKEHEHPYRSVYQRDRDRIIHSAAFRRLEYKTQVYIYHEGDYYRTRLTHTLEVAQIGRTIARALMLNGDLTEALCLVHDIGHTPFGHAGEEVLDELMQDCGGFDHNHQGLRVVDFLEKRYPYFPGLNLSYEVREGILKHKTKWDNADKYLEGYQDLNPEQSPLLEAQVMDVADEIAYDNHDLDDGVKSHLITDKMLKKVSIWQETAKKIKNQYSRLDKKILNSLIVRKIINDQVSDLIKNTSSHIDKLGLKNWRQVREHPQRLTRFSKDMSQMRDELHSFLYQNVYSHWKVAKMSDKGKRLLTDLFNIYCRNPKILLPYFQKRIKQESLKRVICDYTAGMTDRYALEEHKKLFDPDAKV
jgi:dGTPase